MARRLFTLLSAASLALCVATCALWVLSFRNEHRFSLVLRGGRYTVTSLAGRVVVDRPPPEASDPEVSRAAREVVAALRNDQLYWTATFWDAMGDNVPRHVEVDAPEPLFETPADQADTQFVPGEVDRPLLDALEDPERFVAAHALLFRGHTPAVRQSNPEVPSKAAAAGRFLRDERCHHGDHIHQPWIEADFAGLPVTLRRWMERRRGPTMGKDLDQHPLDGDPDASRFDAVRDAWHRRLDVRAGAAPIWPLAAGTGLLPLLWLGRGVRREFASRARPRVGRCARCGYDLRATPGRCPECGAVPAAVTRGNA